MNTEISTAKCDTCGNGIPGPAFACDYTFCSWECAAAVITAKALNEPAADKTGSGDPSRYPTMRPGFSTMRETS